MRADHKKCNKNKKKPLKKKRRNTNFNETTYFELYSAWYLENCGINIVFLLRFDFEILERILNILFVKHFSENIQKYFSVEIVNINRLISISDVGSFKFEIQRVIHQNKLFL